MAQFSQETFTHKFLKRVNIEEVEEAGRLFEERGSGPYELLEKARQIEVKTPYGKSSSKITLGEYTGKKIAFLPGHEKKHQFASHKISYRANIFALVVHITCVDPYCPEPRKIAFDTCKKL